MLHNLSMTQALSLWSELESAYYKHNGYGGDTAELYIYQFMPFDPAIARASPDIINQPGFTADMARETYDQANESLYSLLLHFSKARNVNIAIEGRELGEWVKTARFTHRVHVKVTPQNKKMPTVCA